MHEPDLLQLLADPSCYPANAAVELLQTHISIVALGADRVYKLKKPVRLPFLDFSTLPLRRHFCREEVRLNRRLCPDVYLGTSALRQTSAGPRFTAVGDDDGPGDIDIAVVMRRLPQERMLDRLLADAAVEPDAIAALAHMVAAFHRQADRGDAVRQAGDPDRLAALARENFTEIGAIADHGLDAQLLAAMQRRTALDFERILPRLRDRAASGHVIDGHGDLHARNICMTEPPTIYDCIEFSPAFRCGDVATDLAFLIMDLRYRGAPALVGTFVTTYVDATGDRDLQDLLPPLVGYRAMVRAKVAALAAAEPELASADRDGARASAAAHLQLAAATALDARGPLWLLLCGPPGSGKSTVAAALQRGTAWPCIATDRVRKQLAGLAPIDRAASQHYTPEFSSRTYAAVLERAAAATACGAGVALLDGNFPTAQHRADAARAATAAGATVVTAHIDVDDSVGRARITARLQEPSRISDAGPDQYDALRNRFAVPTHAEGLELHRLDGTAPTAQVAARVLTALLEGSRPGANAPTASTTS